MAIGLLIIGDEILSGRRQDKHVAQSIQTLSAMQLKLDWVRMVGDDTEHLIAMLSEIKASGDICFSFGGIGATPDDLTRACVAKAHGVNLMRHPDAVAAIEGRFGEEAYPNRIIMAELPEGSSIIPNPVNQVPGFSLGNLHCFPGFPEMAWPMQSWVLETYYASLTKNLAIEDSIHVHNTHESDLMDWMYQFEAENPSLQLFSLPRIMEDGSRRIELGVKGERRQVAEAIESIKAMLDAQQRQYSLPKS